MSTNNYIAKLKARLDQAIIQRDHWKQVAANRNYLTVSVIDPDSRTTCEYRVDPDNVRAMWHVLDELRAANQRLEGEVARLKADAERYRWLRKSRWYVGPDDFYCGEGGDMNEYENHNCQAERLDAAIDAELSNMGSE